MRDFTKTLSVVPAGPLLPLLALPLLFPTSASPREVGPPQLGRTLWRLFIAFWEVAGAQQKEFGLWNQAGLGSNSCSDIYLPDDLGQDISLLSLKFLICKPGLLSKLEGSWGSPSSSHSLHKWRRRYNPWTMPSTVPETCRYSRNEFGSDSLGTTWF